MIVLTPLQLRALVDEIESAAGIRYDDATLPQVEAGCSTVVMALQAAGWRLVSPLAAVAPDSADSAEPSNVVALGARRGFALRDPPAFVEAPLAPEVPLVAGMPGRPWWVTFTAREAERMRWMLLRAKRRERCR